MITTPSVLRVKSALLKLETAGSSERVRLWRSIADCALNAHDVELRQMEALKFPMADPALEVPIA